MDNPIWIHEIEKAIQNLIPGKAPGSAGYPTDFHKRCDQIFPILLKVTD